MQQPFRHELNAKCDNASRTDKENFDALSIVENYINNFYWD